MPQPTSVVSLVTILSSVVVYVSVLGPEVGDTSSVAAVNTDRTSTAAATASTAGLSVSARLYQ